MTRSPGAPGHRLWPFIIAALAVAGFLVGGGIQHARHRFASPGAPNGLSVSATTCAPPECGVIRSRVTLTWSPATAGGPVARLAILRDGTAMPGQADLSPLTVRFVDEAVTAGDHHTYAVVAANTAGTARSATVGATLPLPPLAAARLDGTYRVMLVVRRAVNLASLQGIAHPVRGSRGAAAWIFLDPCRANSIRCPARWRGHAGIILPEGENWAGTVTGRRAACFGGVRARAPIRLRLVVRAGSMTSGTWVVSRFSGWSSVRFHCSGFEPSHGTVDVVGLRG
jgi:hypothetical protein